MLIWTCPTFMAKDLSTPSCVRQFRCNMAGNGWAEIEIATYLKASSNVLSLTSKNLANSNDIVKDEATVDVLGMCLLAFLGRYSRCNKCVLSCLGITIIISAWAISVARSTISGNARAFGCGTGSRVVPTLFLCRICK